MFFRKLVPTYQTKHDIITTIPKYDCFISRKIHFLNGCKHNDGQKSALQPLWVMACSTIVEYSQQEGFYRVPLLAARQTPNLEDQWLERSNSRHQVSLTSETTRANPSSGRWNYGWEIAENFAESGDFNVTFGFFYTHTVIINVYISVI